MKLKITGGEFKGRLINAPKGSQTRPTSEKVRQSLFNSIQHLVDNAIIIDVCAGSGAVAIEGLSRGCKTAYLIEQHKLAQEAIKANISTLGLTSVAKLFACPAIDGLKRLEKKNLQANLIFIDPPYKMKNIKFEILHLLDESSVAMENSFIFIEEDKYNRSEVENQEFENICFVKTKTIGETLIHVFKKNPSAI